MAAPQPSTEAADAKLVDHALKLIEEGRLDQAAQALRDVLSRTPADYVRETHEGGTLNIRFWDMEEFMGYVTQRQNELACSVNWLHCAYPRAAYYLGFLEVQQGRMEEAIEALEIGQALDPGHPLFHLEKAQVYMRTGRPAEAVAEFDAVLSHDDPVSRLRWSLAWRQKGVTLIDLNRLDEAEASLRKSLELEPGNRIATQELEYIASLRSGGERAGALGLVQTNSPLVCAVCGSPELDGAKAAQVNNRTVIVCQRCLSRQPGAKKWWQFWK